MTLTEKKNIARNLGAAAFSMDKKLNPLEDERFAALRDGLVWETRAKLMRSWYEGFWKAHDEVKCYGRCATCQSA